MTWEEEWDSLWNTFCKDFPNDMGGATSNFRRDAQALIRTQKSLSVQETLDAVRAKVEDFRSHQDPDDLYMALTDLLASLSKEHGN